MTEELCCVLYVNETTLKNFEQLITNDNFVKAVFDNTTDCSAAALVLDVLYKKLDELKA